MKCVQGESVSAHLQQQLLKPVEARAFWLKLKVRVMSCFS